MDAQRSQLRPNESKKEELQSSNQLCLLRHALWFCSDLEKKSFSGTSSAYNETINYYV